MLTRPNPSILCAASSSTRSLETNTLCFVSIPGTSRLKGRNAEGLFWIWYGFHRVPCFLVMSSFAALCVYACSRFTHCHNCLMTGGHHGSYCQVPTHYSVEQKIICWLLTAVHQNAVVVKQTPSRP